MTSLTQGRRRAARREAPRRRAVEELLRPRAGVVDVHAAGRRRPSRGSRSKFGNKPQVRDANIAAFKAGHAFGETAELFDHPYEVDPAALPPGTYTNINGNTALAWGLVAAGQLSKLPLFLGSYPITPASDILHELSKHKSFGVRTLQAEDEIAGIGVGHRRRVRRPPRASPPRAARAWPSRRRPWAWR